MRAGPLVRISRHTGFKSRLPVTATCATVKRRRVSPGCHGPILCNLPVPVNDSAPPPARSATFRLGRGLGSLGFGSRDCLIDFRVFIFITPVPRRFGPCITPTRAITRQALEPLQLGLQRRRRGAATTSSTPLPSAPPPQRLPRQGSGRRPPPPLPRPQCPAAGHCTLRQWRQLL